MDNKKSETDAITEIARIACELTGVQLNERHHEMIRSRLQKRLGELKLSTHQAYIQYFLSNREQEIPKLIGLMTTHHTYFFREYSHFEFILKTALPLLVDEIRKRSDKTLRVWSAASSRGQEAYSLAMFLEVHLKKLDPTLKYEILGTDIDPESIAIATNGVYLRNELKEVPASMLADNWIKGTGEIENYVKAKKAMRERCTFKVLNLLDPKLSKTVPDSFDFIFCRNVFIYFNQDQVKSITHTLLSKLSKTGYLFVGISESLSQLKLPLANLGPSVYQHKAVETKVAVSSVNAKLPTPIQSLPEKLIRVLCVDDSEVILTLLKRVLNKENGFEIVGTAENGKVAHEKCLSLKPDAITLDIHMPEMTGIEYLEKHFTLTHPPVLMLTSVSRESSDLAGKALKLGAADYIEKPALSNIAEKSDEIRTKIKCAVEAYGSHQKISHGLDQSFQSKKRIIDLSKALKIAVFSLSSRKKVKLFIAGSKLGSEAPTLLVIDANKDLLPSLAEQLSVEFGKKIIYSESLPSTLSPDHVYLAHLDTQYADAYRLYGTQMKTSIQVYGDQSKKNCEKILTWNNAQLVIEELKDGKGAAGLREVANYIVQSTSFEYHAFDFLSSTLQKDGKAA